MSIFMRFRAQTGGKAKRKTNRQTDKQTNSKKFSALLGNVKNSLILFVFPIIFDIFKFVWIDMFEFKVLTENIYIFKQTSFIKLSCMGLLNELSRSYL